MGTYDQFLRTSLTKYKNPDIAKRDVASVFTSFSDLRPKMEDFVFNDGTIKNLLQLDGTIPVNYKGSVYNIPICIWLMDTHPYNPPLVYVKPTSTMQIKVGRNVDQDGKIDLPYLREWRYPNSDLLGMIQILTIVFGEEPPVYSRGAQQQQQQQQQRYPAAGQTPYPAAGAGFPMPMPGVPASGSNNPPYPSNAPYPAAGGAGRGGYPQQQPPQQQQQQQYPGQFAGYQGQQQGGYTGYQPPSSYPSSTSAPSYPGNAPYPTPPYSTASSNNYPATQTSASTVGNSGTNTVTEEHLKASLLSAVEDKMKRRLKETFAQAQAEMDVLYKTQTDLLKGKEKLEGMISGLEREKVDIEEKITLLKQKDLEVKEALTSLEGQDQLNIDDAVVTTAPLELQFNKKKVDIEEKINLLKQKDLEVKEALTTLEGQDQLNIDDAVVTTAPLYRQLLNAFAEEQALEDAIYYLGEALRKDVIDLEVFLKQVRELSRKQFMQRALIRKCREKAGLPAIA